MNRVLPLLSILFLVTTFACQKKTEEVQAPAKAPERAEIEQPQQFNEDAKPNVQVVDDPTKTTTIAPTRLNLDDVFFDFDKADIRADSREALNRYASVLRANNDIQVLIEGHCDERGTEEYNLGLGERRANRVREYLISLGIGSDRLKTISYGEMRPAMSGNDEGAWARNRRAHFNLSR